MDLKKRVVNKSIKFIKKRNLSKRKVLIVLIFGLTFGNLLNLFEKIFKRVCNRKKTFATAFTVLAMVSIFVTYFFYMQNKEDDSVRQVYYQEEKATVQIMEDTRSYTPTQVNEFLYIEGVNRYMLKVNRLTNCITAYTYDSNGEYSIPVKSMVCSVGREGHETPLGSFKLGDRSVWCLLVNDTWGQYAYRINGPIMFHSVPYEDNTKDSLEQEEYNKLGEAASLGCVRLSVRDAKWIYDNCVKGTVVEIYEDEIPGPLDKPEALKLPEGTNWDPTDPDENNPFN